MKHKNATSAARKSIATTSRHHNAGRDVAIIGGGIGGLTAALAFAQHGANVSLYEQAPALTEVGAGLQITPNGARALHALGLRRVLDLSCVTAQAVEPMDALTGKVISRFDLSKQRPNYRFFHRAALIDLLARACHAQGVNVTLNAKVETVKPDGSFKIHQTDVKPDITIGAEGLRSGMRGLINIPSEPFFTGQVAWRAIIKSAETAPVAKIWMAPKRHLVTYPLQNGRLNIVAVQERSQWAEEGWHHGDDPGNLRAAFADCCWEVKALLGAVEKVNLWGLFRHPVAAKWQRGAVAILGDAAHPTLPFLAQGANLAIEDAFELARSCDQEADIRAGLSHYQSIRRPRVVKAIKAANANARNYHLSGVRRMVAHNGLKAMGKIAPDAFLKRLGWLYDYDVTQ